MPILQIDTNLLTSPSDFSTKTCELMADIFKSPLHVRTCKILYYNNLLVITNILQL